VGIPIPTTGEKLSTLSTLWSPLFTREETEKYIAKNPGADPTIYLSSGVSPFLPVVIDCLRYVANNDRQNYTVDPKSPSLLGLRSPMPEFIDPVFAKTSPKRSFQS
jgi:hypothetical protein